VDVAYVNSGEFTFFSDAQEQFDQPIDQLSSEDNENNEHRNIEKHINTERQELLRWLLQSWLSRKAANEANKNDYICAILPCHEINMTQIQT